MHSGRDRDPRRGRISLNILGLVGPRALPAPLALLRAPPNDENGVVLGQAPVAGRAVRRHGPVRQRPLKPRTGLVDAAVVQDVALLDALEADDLLAVEVAVRTDSGQLVGLGVEFSVQAGEARTIEDGEEDGDDADDRYDGDPDDEALDAVGARFIQDVVAGRKEDGVFLAGSHCVVFFCLCRFSMLIMCAEMRGLEDRVSLAFLEESPAEFVLLSLDVRIESK